MHWRCSFPLPYQHGGTDASRSLGSCSLASICCPMHRVAPQRRFAQALSFVGNDPHQASSTSIPSTLNFQWRQPSTPVFLSNEHPTSSPPYSRPPITYLDAKRRLGDHYGAGANISTTLLVEMFSSCTKLERLAWIAPRCHPKTLEAIRNGVNWQFQLQELRITYGLLPAFPPLVLSRLTSLSERLYPGTGQVPIDGSTGTEDDRLHLPRLRELTVMSLTPQVVKIEDRRNGGAIEAFLARAPIVNLIELQMNVGTWAYSSDGRLARLFSADIGKQSSLLFPHLKCLIVKLHKWDPRGLDVTMEERQGISEALSGLPYPVIVC
ncbi:hypothetical protein FRB91_010742 [Serendipita sp. 411]|nr:hypothetical protein FRB91_010742 [Serendipita sp. 411]